MIALTLLLLLNQSPTLAGSYAATMSHSSGVVADYTTSLYLTAPSGAALCADAAITTDQGAAINVTRATTATCEVTAGDLRTISSGRPVVEPFGLRVESASSNRVDYSEDIAGQWGVVSVQAGVSTTTAPNGVVINNLETAGTGGYYISNGFTITGTSAVLSIFIQGSGTENVTVELFDNTDGFVVCSISTVAPATWPEMKSRPSCSSTSITSGNTHVINVFPGGVGGDSVNPVFFWGAQVEPGTTLMSSYIPTSGTATTRNADNITTTVAAANAAGCFSTTFYARVAAFPLTIASNPATLGNFGGTTTMLANDGTNTATSNSVASMTSRSETMRLIWSGVNMQLGLGGLMGVAATFDGTMSGGLTTLYLGSLSGTSRHMNGWIRNLKFGTSGTGCAL